VRWRALADADKVPFAKLAKDDRERYERQIAAYVPYMVSIGNHENNPDQLAHFTERKRLINENIAVLALEAQRNGKEETTARSELRKADNDTKPERERKLGALEAQRIKLVELNLALNDEITFCTAEIVEMQSKHGAQVAMDSSERAQKLAEESQAEIQRQLAEQKLAVQKANDRKHEIDSAEIKLQAALKAGGLSERDQKDAELQLRDLESERTALDEKKRALAAQAEDLAKATVEFEAASKATKAHGSGSVAVRKLIEQQLALRLRSRAPRAGVVRRLGSLQGKSKTNLPIPVARQRLEMRESLCCATLVAAHACSKHVLEPLRASAER
jgi:myosin heavy subunit